MAGDGVYVGRPDDPLRPWPDDRRTILAVQNMILGAIVVIASILAVIGAVAVLDRRGRVAPLQIALGLGIGLLGAFVVLVSRIDLIPDDPGDGLERVIVIAVTLAAIVGTWYRIVRA